MKPEHRVKRPSRLALLLGLAITLMVLPTRDAAAQYALSIPFNPWQAQYEAFVYPVVSGNPALPNQARLQYSRQFSNGREGGVFNPFADYSSWLDAYVNGQSLESPGNRGRVGATNGGRYIPYYSFNRLYDAAYNRQYTPNAEVDKAYYENRQRREDLYLRSLSENDPQKRAELLRELEQANRASRNELGVTRRRLPGQPSASASPASPTRFQADDGRRSSANPSTARSRASLDRDVSAIPPAPNALERPTTRAPGLPPSSLSRPRNAPGIGRPNIAPRPLAPGLESRNRGASEDDPIDDAALRAPSRRRGPAGAPPSQ